MDEKEYTLWEHLGELRDSLVRATIGVLAIAIVAYVFSDILLDYVRVPMETALHAARGPQSQFQILGAVDYVFCQMKAALYMALFVGSPWVFYQLWRFIAPGLYAREQKLVITFVMASSFCFIVGAAVGYTIFFPSMFQLLLAAIPTSLTVNLDFSVYFDFFINMMLAFGIIFETPVLIVLLSYVGIIDPRTVTQYRRHVIVLALIISAVLTPSTDMWSQAALAIPMLVLFEVGVMVARVVVRKK